MSKHSMKDYPREAVGIITRDFEYIPCLNLSDTPKVSFYLDPAALVRYDGNIWGIFHSHPGEGRPIPSSEDKVSAAFSQYKYIVGFNDIFHIYWLDKKLNALKFEIFKETHCVT